MDVITLLFGFQGRIGRGQFWAGVLMQIGLSIITAIIIATVGSNTVTAYDTGSSMYMFAVFSNMNPIGMMVYFAYLIINLWISLALGVKRCHDRGQSGWWMLITLVPVIGFFWWLINLGLLAGDRGDNRFGPNPAMQ